MQIPAPALRTLQEIVGKQAVCTDTASLLLHAYDCSLSRMRPDLLVHVAGAGQVAPVISVLHHFHIPFVARAAATNHAGSCSTPLGGAVLNLAALNHILEINTQEAYAWVEPGVITAQLNDSLEPLGFFYAPDPASQKVCTLGGNLAQNASDHVLAVNCVLPDGTTHTLSRQENGPDWVGLLCGSEGTLGLITKLKVKIRPRPACVRTFLVTFPSLEESIEAVTDLVSRGVIARCIEAMDQRTVRAVEDFAHAGYPTRAQALLLLELDGTEAQIKKEEEILQAVCRQHHAQTFRAARSSQEQKELWKGRQAAYAAMARLAPNVLACDGTVPRSELPSTLRRVQQILEENNVTASLLFHAGDGNFHPQLIFDERNKLDTRHVSRVAQLILQACVTHGGTISGEHGIGVEKRSLMCYQYDEATLDLFAQIKAALDPDNLANPGKIIPIGYHEKEPAKTPENSVFKQCREDFLAQLSRKNPFAITGRKIPAATKNALFSTSKLNQITDVDLANYTVTAQAGVSLKELAQTLKKHRVFSALPAVGEETLGGVFSSGCYPGFYAYVTGLQAVLPNGKIIRYGGKLTKNAAGYNLIRLFAGAQGTLGLITELTFKIYASKQDILTTRAFKPLTQNKFFTRLKNKLDPQHLLIIPEEEPLWTTPH